jgi:signal transduction histidine kinase
MPPETARELLGLIDGQVLRAQRIVDTLLDFARDRQFARRSEALRPLLDEVLLLLRSELAGEPRIDLRIPPGLSIDVDRQRFQQVLLNLLKNAVDAAGLQGRVVLTAAPDERGGVTVSVQDDGPGISAAALPRIFDPFYSTKPVGQGTGLGLFIVHEIVSQHGGTVSVESEPGRGARFSVHVPDHRKTETSI